MANHFICFVEHEGGMLYTHTFTELPLKIVELFGDFGEGKKEPKMFSLYICRICEKQSYLIDISNNSMYIEQYLIIGNVSYDIYDGLPKFLCRFCITQLLHFVRFKQKCHKTYRKFQNLLLETHIEIKTEVNRNEDNQNNWNADEDNITKTEIYGTTALDDNDDNNELLTEITVNLDNEDPEIIIAQQESKTLSKINSKQKFICEICESETTNTFESMPNLELHMKKCHGMAANVRQCDQCDKNSKWFSYRQLHVHNRKRHTKPYKCEQCDKYFSRKYVLVTHARTHTGEKPYKCEYCHKTFPIKNTLVVHTRTHTGEKPFKCKYCDKCFVLKQMLVQHIRTHTGEKPYKCTLCNKCFSQKTSLVQHIRTHTGETPYKCKYCDKYFSVKTNLSRHNKITCMAIN